MKNFFIKLKTWTLANKTKSVIIGLIFIVIIYAISRFFVGSAQETQYILSTAQRGTIVSTVSGSGQVEASNELKVVPRSSGVITSVKVSNGDKVKKGQLLFTIDSRDAQKSVRDSQLALDSAIADQTKTLKNYQTDVQYAYTTLLNSGLQAMPGDDGSQKLTAPSISGNYNLEKEGIINVTTYASTGGYSFNLSGLVSGSGLVSSITPQPIGNSGLFILFPSSSTYDNQKWSISIPNKNSSTYVSNYNNYQTALKNLKEAQELDTSSAYSIQAKKNALIDAKQNLSDYYVTALFEGTIANITAKIGDNASSGTSLGTLITHKNIVSVSLNEVDITKVKLGQKAIMTFDAIEDFETTGKVVSIDSLGTVSSGVVNYEVKIAFDTDSDNIKPGMSVSASIVTNIKQDIITVPISAIKNQNGVSYIEITKEDVPVSEVAQNPVSLLSQPETVEVQTGISNDESIEIISGISEGEKYILRTIKSSSTSKATSSSAPSLFGTPGSSGTRSGGMPSGGGNFPR